MSFRLGHKRVKWASIVLLFIILCMGVRLGSSYVYVYYLAPDIFKFAEIGDEETVRTLVRKMPELLHLRDEINNMTISHWCAWHGQTKLLKELLDGGANSMDRSSGGFTALHYAANSATAELLLLYGADVNDEIPALTPLESAAARWNRQNSELVLTLIKAGANPKVGSPISRAAYTSDVDTVRVLLEHGADPNNADNGPNSWNPLFSASSIDHIEMAEILLDAGAIISRDDGILAIHVVQSIKMASLLFRHGADLNSINFRGCTPLHSAANVEVAQFLLDNGANINAKAKYGETALHTAAEDGRNDVILLLLHQGLDVNSKDDFHRTPLHYAINSGPSNHPEETVRLLLRAGAEVNVQDDHNYETPLDYSFNINNLGIQKILIEAGAKRGILPE